MHLTLVEGAILPLSFPRFVICPKKSTFNSYAFRDTIQ